MIALNLYSPPSPFYLSPTPSLIPPTPTQPSPDVFFSNVKFINFLIICNEILI